jgi:hypothetical protein
MAYVELVDRPASDVVAEEVEESAEA